MAAIVLVHGIAQEQEAADTLETEWVPALAGGVRAAGYGEIADRLWRDRSIEVRMAFYGRHYLRADQQGADPGELSATEAAGDQGAGAGMARTRSRAGLTPEGERHRRA